MAVQGTAPPYTWSFGIYILISLASEIYNGHFRILFSESYYHISKAFHRFGLFVTIGIMSDGGIVETILECGAIVMVFKVIKHHSNGDRVWKMIEELDLAILIFLIVYLIGSVTSDGWSMFMHTRNWLLIVLFCHISVIIYREMKRFEPGCTLDKINAMTLAVLMNFTAIFYLSN